MLLHLIFLIIGLLLFIYSLTRLKREIAYLHKCRKVEGRVVRLNEIESDEGIYYQPVFEFSTEGNEVFTYRHSVSASNPGKWPLGKARMFSYHPDNPDSARILNYDIFKFTMVLMGCGLSLMLIGLGYFLCSIFIV